MAILNRKQGLLCDKNQAQLYLQQSYQTELMHFIEGVSFCVASYSEVKDSSKH